jgi:hypothetical protein
MTIIMTAPYPTLFHHLEEVRKKVEELNNEDARRDLMALKYIVGVTAGRLWKEARALDPGLVRYNLIWSLFRAGELVVRNDDLDNEWLYVLLEVKKVQQRTRRVTKQVATAGESDEELEIVVWSLVWDGPGNQLTRKTAHFFVSPFQGLAPINSLPVYPLRCRPGDEEGFKHQMAERGRRWWNLMTSRTACRRYNDLAYAHSGAGGGLSGTLKVGPLC